MTVHLIHGFNVTDGGKGSIRKLGPFISSITVPHDYGYAGLITLRCVNAKAVDQITLLIKRGDFLVCHSNGCLIAWHIANKLRWKLGGVVVINAALRRDTQWPSYLPVLCLHNSSDNIVQLGRAWSRLVSLGGIHPHGWGAAGKYGLDAGRIPNNFVENLDTADDWWGYPVKGHSGMFKDKYTAEFWADIINSWMMSVKYKNLIG